MTFAENGAFVTALNPAADAAGRTSVYFSLKNAKKALFVVDIGHEQPVEWVAQVA